MRNTNIIRMSARWIDGLRETMTLLPSGKWVPARPLGWSGIKTRVQAAWLVFTGRADALIWAEDCEWLWSNQRPRPENRPVPRIVDPPFPVGMFKNHPSRGGEVA